MSITPFESENIREAILTAGVAEHEHVILNSGRHSFTKLHMERLVDDKGALEIVRDGLVKVLDILRPGAVVPVPSGAVALTEAMEFDYSPDFPYKLIPPHKLSSRQFLFTPRQKRLLREFKSIVVLEDVVTTGGTPSAVADAIHYAHPEADISLVAIWRRGILEPSSRRRFVSQAFLVEKQIQDWSPSACPHHGPFGADV